MNIIMITVVGAVERSSRAQFDVLDIANSAGMLRTTSPELRQPEFNQTVKCVL